MSTATLTRSTKARAELQLITFYVDELFLGVDINRVKEINRHVDVTPTPHAPEYVRGVVNLRGEVVTVVDLRCVLRLPVAEVTRQNRNVVVNSDTEAVGLLVDRVADVVTAVCEDIEPSPSNVGGVEGSFFKGVYRLDSELLVILDVDKVLDASNDG